MTWRYLGIYQQCLTLWIISGLFNIYPGIEVSNCLKSSQIQIPPLAHCWPHVIHCTFSRKEGKDKVKTLKEKKKLWRICRVGYHHNHQTISAIVCIQIISKILRYGEIIICKTELATWEREAGPGPHLEKCLQVDWSSNRTLWPGLSLSHLPLVLVSLTYCPSVGLCVNNFMEHFEQIIGNNRKFFQRFAGFTFIRDTFNLQSTIVRSSCSQYFVNILENGTTSPSLCPRYCCAEYYCL